MEGFGAPSRLQRHADAWLSAGRQGAREAARCLCDFQRPKSRRSWVARTARPDVAEVVPYAWTGTDEFEALGDRQDRPPIPLPGAPPAAMSTDRIGRPTALTKGLALSPQRSSTRSASCWSGTGRARGTRRGSSRGAPTYPCFLRRARRKQRFPARCSSEARGMHGNFAFDRSEARRGPRPPVRAGPSVSIVSSCLRWRARGRQPTSSAKAWVREPRTPRRCCPRRAARRAETLASCLRSSVSKSNTLAFDPGAAARDRPV